MAMMTPFQRCILLTRKYTARCFSSRRAILYSATGDPAQVLSVSKISPLPEAIPVGHVGVKFLLSPINPADLNVVQGVYPSKPEIRYDLGTPSPSFVGGNEGVGQVERVGEGVKNLSAGDWVIMAKPQSGTWVSHAYANSQDVIPIDKRIGGARAATITVNPPTARGMLTDFRSLSAGDYVIQNGANSAVGQAVIQIAAARNLRTINVVRDRPNVEELKQYLTSLGATHVITDQELTDEATRRKVKEWTGGKGIKLGLNCVGGKPTAVLAKYLGADAALVSYGAMSMAPLSLPTSLFIFKVSIHDFSLKTSEDEYREPRISLHMAIGNLAGKYETHNSEERQSMLQEITGLMLADKLKAPEHEVLCIENNMSDQRATQSLREKLLQVAAGRFGKKVLLKFD
ncbi:Mitochondrial trans-2-enoyl-CoA reductase [Ceratobasidium theobromae]|uniref:enoyl-[acyl-carrier-protein] reductase n=1 Tax=Ceratobasidium theobromae TaxID=1582974 RepID=A0A5N5QTN9_9AGAM|nr:Mitochondrial trans-2-enoyl-CoA reductase [Ceratobasidium theobromae]